MAVAEPGRRDCASAEEKVRELVQNGVLGRLARGSVCRVDIADVAAPPTIQAAISARVAQLSASAE